MLEQRTEPVACPHCGEPLEILVDLSQPRQDYVEDCEVCCRPMRVRVRVAGPDEVAVTVSAENG